MSVISIKSFIGFGSPPFCIVILLAHSTIAIAIWLDFGTGIPLLAQLRLPDFLSYLQHPLILFRYEVKKEDDFQVASAKHVLLFLLDVRLVMQRVHRFIHRILQFSLER